MRPCLSEDELLQIEAHIDQLDGDLSILDPENPLESQEIEQKAHLLRFYIVQLEATPKRPHLYLV